MSTIAKSLKFSEYGEPAKVLHIVEDKLDAPKDNQVLVKILAAPVNPSDVMTIQGKYAIKRTFPATGGNECVGEIVSIGSAVKSLKPGLRVKPFYAGIGTWTTHVIFNEEQLVPVSNDIGIAEAATLFTNPCTAYRMLKDFVQLKPGDCVIQNGANSAVGQVVHQLCKTYKFKSVGIVRNRPDIDELKKHLKSLGADEIFTEEEIRTTNVFKDGVFPQPLLAFNCVGAKSVNDMLPHLDSKAFVVTYGAMSDGPALELSSSIIFNDYTFRSFWMTRWAMENRNSPERLKMLNELSEMLKEGKITAPVHEIVPFQRFKDAVTGAGFSGKKYILDMQS